MSATKIKSYGDAGFVAGDIYDAPLALSGKSAINNAVLGVAGKQMQIVGLQLSVSTASVIVLEGVIGSNSTILTGYCLPNNGTYSEKMEQDVPLMTLDDGASLSLTLTSAPTVGYGRIQYRFR